ncbi:MAG: FkbM family methyltransferase [Anaerolineae bacterium]|nr:FkbM family methyltransferase [Anaerolineae bacterium]
MNLVKRVKGKVVYEWSRLKRVTRRGYRVTAHYPVERHGSDYGGWTICPEGLSPQSIVYSFGVGEDISFDLSLIERYGVQVYAFDPTPRSIDWVNVQTLPPQFHFSPYGIADRNGTARFYPPENPAHVSHTVLFRDTTAENVIDVPMKTLDTIAAELQHSHIDILKMDIEGAEYAVIPSIVNSRATINQILVEFHHRFDGITPRQTRNAVVMLRKNGYDLFHVSETEEEFAFIKT